MSMPFFSSSRLAYHGGYKTTAMLCNRGAKDNWQCKLTAAIRRQPCSVAVAPKVSHLSHQCKPCSVAMAPGSSPLLFSVCSVCCMLCRRAHLFVALVTKRPPDMKEQSSKRSAEVVEEHPRHQKSGRFAMCRQYHGDGRR